MSSGLIEAAVLAASSWSLDINLPLVTGGLALGAIYGIVALGFVLVYKSTGVLNLAQGDFLAGGAYLSITLLIADATAKTNRLPFLVALPILAAICALFGAIIHWGIMRRLVGRPFFSIVLVTIGIGLIIKSAVQIKYGTQEKGRLSSLPKGGFKVGEAQVTWVQVITLIIVAALLMLFLLFFRFTRMGLHIRAVADNLEAAAVQGIDPDRVYGITWMVSVALAGVGGMLLGHQSAIAYDGVSSLGLQALPAAVIGGFTSLGGAIIGGIIVGVAEQLFGFHLGQNWRLPASYILLFIMLMVKPTGLFGRKDIERV